MHKIFFAQLIVLTLCFNFKLNFIRHQLCKYTSIYFKAIFVLLSAGLSLFNNIEGRKVRTAKGNTPVKRRPCFM